MKAGDNSLTLPAPPVWQVDGPGGGWISLLPAMGGLGSIGLLAMAPRSPFVYIAGGLFLLTTVGMVLATTARGRRQRSESRKEVRDRYLRELRGVRELLADRDRSLRQRESAAEIDKGSLRLPIGYTTVDRSCELVVEPTDDADPFCVRRAEALCHAHRSIPEVPFRLDVRGLRVSGEPGEVRMLLRFVVASVIRSLPPDAVRIAVLTDDPAAWKGVEWAPHLLHPRRSDRSGPLRLISTDDDELGALTADLGIPLLLVDDRLKPAASIATAAWRLTARPGDGPAISVADGNLTGAEISRSVRAARCSAGELEAVARRAARGRQTSAGAPAAVWDEIGGPLRPLIGERVDGAPLALDIREAGEGGMGPHGVLVGATGSGKSELLRLIVCRLVMQHDPDSLAFVFVDYKGGATFSVFQGIPHLAASITNLEDDPGLTTRACIALTAEIERRQRVIRSHGVGAIGELPQGVLPRLLVIVDEFSELLAQHHEMLDVLVQIGRLGRSLGVHLLVSSQRLDEGRIKGLDSHLSYRIALRTQSASESRAVIGVPDAASLPSRPGEGYLAHPGGLMRFSAGCSLDPAGASRPADDVGVVRLALRNGPETAAHPVSAPGPTVLDRALEQAGRYPTRARTLWAEPPARTPRLSELYDDLEYREGRGFGTLSGGADTVRIGWVDRPDRQAVERCELDLGAGRGHVGIVGATRSGASTLLRTIVLSAALRSTPDELNVLLVDLSGGSTADLAGLPHTAASADARRPERVTAVVEHCLGIIADRERRPGSHVPRVLLAVDGMARVRSEHELLEPLLVDIARRGLATGVHLVCTAHRWLDLRPALRDQLGTRLELRLGEPIESEIDRKAAAQVPRGRPGRGLTPDGHPLYVAHDLPAPDGLPIARRIAEAWRGGRPRGLVELPPMLSPEQVSEDVRSRGLALAADRATGRALLLDDAVRFCLVIGDPGSGRSSVLRSLGLQDAERGARLVVLDPRRSLLDDLPDSALLGYAPAPAATDEAVAGLVTGLRRRMPPADLRPDQLRSRSWWSGPDIHLLVDDYDLLTLSGGSLADLRPFLPYAADIGLRVTIARRAAGAGRALHDELLSVLRDLGAAALLLSSSPDEGVLLRMKPGRQPFGRGSALLPGRTPCTAQAIVAPRRSGG